tara:strand:+ start:3439 stop:3873 length:435 start_codon:yes stop_codon:yes gene_type:complete
LTQLSDLAKPFTSLVKSGSDAGKFGDYVEHSAVTQRLLAHLGPFDQRVVEIVYDTHPDLGQVCTGVILELTLYIDGEQIKVQEVGDVEHPFQKGKNNGSRLKNAISDAIKRCAMRVGLGLHLYAQDDYFLDKLLEDKNGTSQKN